MIRAEDIHYEYDTRGYMIYYKNKPIYGAGIDKHAKGCMANLKLFKELAEKEKRSILSGRICNYTKALMSKIDGEMKAESNNAF